MAYRKRPELLKKDILAEKLEEIEFELLSFGHWQQEGTPDLTNDILSNYKLVCIIQGTCTVKIDNQSYYLNTGDSIIIAPFVIYTAMCTGTVPVEFFDFHFTIQNVAVQGIFHELFRIQLAGLYPSSIPAAAIPMLNLSYENMIAGKPGSYYSTKLSFLRAMLNLLTISPDYVRLDSLPRHIMGKEKIVAECVKYLKSHEAVQVTVNDLCHAMHVSQSYLYQSFLSITGQSTKEFIITYKLKLVELDLKHSSHSIQSIAEAFGFSSVYALSSQFKRFYGISPLQYRHRFLNTVE